MHELLTTVAMRRADALAIAAGIPGQELMERAGRAVADHAATHHPPGGRILVACGPGNNGGDGFVAARILAEEGYQVEVYLLGSRDALTGDAAWAAGEWQGEARPLAEIAPDASCRVVDALFGAGLSRDLDGEAAAAVARINASGAFVIAADIPSGIDGDTGAVRGIAIEATETVTFVRRKPGHLLLPGRAHCGRVTVADIGIDDEIIASLASPYAANAPDLWLPAYRRPSLAGHKYGRGHAVVVSGGMSTTGAARLAARAALRAGAGLVTVASPPNALAVNAAHLTAIMVHPVDGAEGLRSFLADDRLNAVVLGPGAGRGEATRAMITVAASAGRALVIDADGLTSFAGEGRELAQLTALIAANPAPVVLTPHEGEFAQIFKGVDQVLQQPSKLLRAVAAARQTGAVVVLKGADTVIASPDGAAIINENGTPWLATAGTGDVLAGMIGGLVAQGMPGREAAAAAVWLHGAAAMAFGPGLIAEDLPEKLPEIWRRLLKE
jgi:NAD(P)H-hydrate epimerase